MTTKTDDRPVPDGYTSIQLPGGYTFALPDEPARELWDTLAIATMTKPLTVHQAIAAVMAELEGVGKDERGPAEQGGYAYRGIEAVTGALQKLCAKHGVVIWPSARVVDAQESIGMKKGWFDWRVEVTYQVAGPDGSKLDPPIEVVGIGRDNSDKGVNKAMTQAYKYALLQLFMVADPRDDTDKHGGYDQGRLAEGQASDSVAVDADGVPWITTEEADRLRGLIGKLSESQRAAVVAEWVAEDPMEGGTFLPTLPDDPSRPSIRHLRMPMVPAVEAIIARVKASEPGEAPVSPQDAPADDPASDTAGDAHEGSEDPEDCGYGCDGETVDANCPTHGDAGGY